MSQSFEALVDCMTDTVTLVSAAGRWSSQYQPQTRNHFSLLMSSLLLTRPSAMSRLSRLSRHHQERLSSLGARHNLWSRVTKYFDLQDRSCIVNSGLLHSALAIEKFSRFPWPLMQLQTVAYTLSCISLQNLSPYAVIRVCHACQPSRSQDNILLREQARPRSWYGLHVSVSKPLRSGSSCDQCNMYTALQCTALAIYSDRETVYTTGHGRPRSCILHMRKYTRESDLPRTCLTYVLL